MLESGLTVRDGKWRIPVLASAPAPALSAPAAAEDKLLAETVDFTGSVLFLDSHVHMDAMGLGGIFVSCAFAPGKNIGAFVAINQFDFAAAMSMAGAVNDTIATLAPR